MFKESLKIFGAVTLAFVIISLVSLATPGNHQSIIPDTSQAQVIAADTVQADIFPISRVIDGDTVVVDMNGTNETVRLIGVNTPETVDPRKPVQCFGKEASNFVKSMLAGKSVRLQSDPTQADRDKYGRLLRYVYLDDVLVNEEIISSGYGFEYTYDIPYQFQKEFRASEGYARSGSLGLWAPTTCNGQLKPAS